MAARRPSVPPCHPGGLTSGGQPQILHHMVNYIPSLDQTFAALGDPTRRAILARLEREGSATVSQLAQPFAIKLPAVMKHLDVLGDAGLVEIGRAACRERVCRCV